MNNSGIIIFASVFVIILLIGITTFWGSSDSGMLAGYSVSVDNLDGIRFDPMYIFGALGLVSLVCLAARVYFKRYDTQN